MTKTKEKITAVAELTVISPKGKEIVRSFDKAWHRTKDLPLPARATFNGFVRLDESL